MVKRIYDYTPRQQKILQLLFENKVMAREHIARQIFPERVPSIASESLKRLQQEILIQKTFDSSLQRKNCFFYQIFEDGIEAVKKFYPHEIIGNPKRSYAVNHDLGLTDLREKIERKESVERYYTENVLNFSREICEEQKFKSYIDIQSDAVLTVKNPEETLTGALEFEPTAKNFDRYRSKIFDYYTKKEIRFVLYVYTNDSTMRVIRQVEDEIKPDGKTKLYFSSFENVMNSAQVLTFHGRNKSQFEIK